MKAINLKNGLPWKFRIGRWLSVVDFTLLVAVFLIAIFGLDDAVSGLIAYRLVMVTIIGLLVGLCLVRSKIPGFFSAIIVVPAGLIVILLPATQLGAKVERLTLELAKLGVSLARNLTYEDSVIDPRLLEAVTLDTVSYLNGLASQFTRWMDAQLAGNPVFYSSVVMMLWGFVLWGCAIWAVWHLHKTPRPLLALLPISLLFVTTRSFANLDTSLTLSFLAASLLLIVVSSFDHAEREWQGAEIDYPEDLGIDVGLSAIGIILLVIMFAWAVWVLPIDKIASFAKGLTQGYSLDESDFSQSLGIKQSPPDEGSGFTGLVDVAPGLPRNHLLKGGPELSEELVMTIHVKDETDQPNDAQSDSPGLSYYWKQISFEEYTGQGWLVGEVQTKSYPAGEFLLEEIPARTQLVEQEVQLFGDRRRSVYQAGILLSVDKSIDTAWLLEENGELSEMNGATFSDGERPDGQIYRALSLVTVAGEADLRDSGRDYPDWVSKRYIDLPDAIPDRVIALAQELTVDKPTTYEKALAIEEYLRGFPYTLDLPTPPVDQDVVDYFLFEEKRGYCDYYASAMVVLARAVGIPARLAIGYGSGTFDSTENRYIVTEENAHSWVEIYFPDTGWITFEPTAGRPSIERPDQAPQLTSIILENRSASESLFARFPGFEWIYVPFIGALLLFTAITGWMAVDSFILQRSDPHSSLNKIYQRMHKIGERITSPPTLSYTPHEYASTLSNRLRTLSDRRHLHRMLKPASNEIATITNLFARAIYSQHAISAHDRGLAIRHWMRLRWRLGLARLFGRRKRKKIE